jgi:hypothetical protein
MEEFHALASSIAYAQSYKKPMLLVYKLVRGAR